MTNSRIIEDRKARCRFWRDEGVYHDIGLADAFAHAARAHGDTRAIFHSRVRPSETTVAQAFADTDRLASAFHALGLRAGDRLAIMLPTWQDTLLAYFAAFKLGLTVVPIVAIYGAREIGFIMRQTGARGLVIPDMWRGFDYPARVGEAGEMPDLEYLIVVGDAVPAGAVAWSDLRDHRDTAYPAARVDGDDICTIIYTSGTTADPKGVMHSHNSLLCEINAARFAADAAGRDRLEQSGASAAAGAGPVLSVFPAGHIASFLTMTRPFLAGGDAVFMDQWIAADAAALIETYGCSATSGTPVFLSTLIDAARDTGRDISSLQRFALGASAITPENIRWTDALGFPSGRMYGSTEHPLVSAGGSDSFEKRAFTDGKLSQWVEVRILDEQDRDLPPGAEGDIVVRGPRLFMGYVDSQLDEAAFLPGGWFRTGDIGRLDDEQFLTITDRRKDIIIRGGENISSKEIEDILASLPGVVESAVTAMPDPELGERVCAHVMTSAGTHIRLEDVQAHFRTLGITRQKIPEHVVLVDDFPRTPSGKIRKNELRDALRRAAKETP
jgi:acyl-CoA synthetase (AMP-forming)/AMP-acid ligase II